MAQSFQLKNQFVFGQYSSYQVNHRKKNLLFVSTLFNIAKLATL